MNSRTWRIVLRVIAIAAQWAALTTALGSLVMRSDASFSQLISPHLGGAPVFFAAAVAGFLLGLTIESPKVLAVLVLLMCVCSAAFIGVLSYAPVYDGLLLRTTQLDNYVLQRTMLMTLVVSMAAIPGAVGGNLFGANLGVHQEIAPHPEDFPGDDETPWWERRYDTDTGQRPV